MLASLRLLCLFVFLALVRDGLASAEVGGLKERLTNAERLARGLRVASRPKRLYSSRTESARRGMISGVPGQTIIGTISIVAGGTTYTLTNDGRAASHTPPGVTAGVFEYTDEPTADGPVSLTILNPPGSSPAYLAFAENSNSGDLKVNTRDDATLVYTNTITPPRSTPVSASYDGGEFTGYLETSIFSVDPTTGLITVTWVNPTSDPGTAQNLNIYVYTASAGPTYQVLMLSGTADANEQGYGYSPVTSIIFTQTG